MVNTGPTAGSLPVRARFPAAQVGGLRAGELFPRRLGARGALFRIQKPPQLTFNRGGMSSASEAAGAQGARCQIYDDVGEEKLGNGTWTREMGADISRYPRGKGTLDTFFWWKNGEGSHRPSRRHIPHPHRRVLQPRTSGPEDDRGKQKVLFLTGNFPRSYICQVIVPSPLGPKSQKKNRHRIAQR